MESDKEILKALQRIEMKEWELKMELKVQQRREIDWQNAGWITAELLYKISNNYRKGK